MTRRPDGLISYAEARHTQATVLGRAIPAIRDQVEACRTAGRLSGVGPIVVGIGASLAAAWAPVWSMRERGIDSWRLGAGDLPLPFPDSIHPMIAVSQSGHTAETMEILASVPASRRLAVTNRRPSPIAQAADSTIWLGDLPDSFASTVGYTATLAGLGMLADAWSGGAIADDWDHIPSQIEAIVEVVDRRADELADSFDGISSADFIGGGPSVGSAEVGALLGREVARVPATAMGVRQYLHGPMESAGQSVHILLGDGREIEIARMLAGHRHPVILVSAEAVAEQPYLLAVRIARSSPGTRAIVEAVVMQAIAGAVADRRGIDSESFVFADADPDRDLGSPMSSAAS